MTLGLGESKWGREKGNMCDQLFVKHFKKIMVDIRFRFLTSYY